MIINDIDYYVEIYHPEQQQTLVFLHGFTGSTSTWHPVIPYFPEWRIVLIDLLGHGQTSSPTDVKRYRMEHQLDDLQELFKCLNIMDFILAGYSMGGRTALAYACTYPAGIRQLILESASPGLRTEAERQQRIQQDHLLAERIEREGVSAFTSYWESIPLFASQQELPEKVQQMVRTERLKQKAAGLAGSLYGMGTGVQRSYWEHLQQLSIPVLLLTGTKDKKFTVIAREMEERLPVSTHREVNAGHAIHVEKPEEFATIIRQWLQNDF